MRRRLGSLLRTLAAVVDPGEPARLASIVPPCVNSGWEDDEAARSLRLEAAELVLGQHTRAVLVVAVVLSEVKIAGDVAPVFWPALSATLGRVAAESRA